ncbi:response regulator [Roseivivax sp. CAU 1761]
MPRKRVLICEDEPIVALDLQFLVEDMGYEPIGPFSRVSDGERAARSQHVDAAILDVRLLDGEVFPVANALLEKNVELIFHSGHALSHEILAAYPNARCCPKPLSTSQLTKALGDIVAASDAETVAGPA